MAAESTLKNPTKAAKRLLRTLKNDLEDHLLTIDLYLSGDHPGPYMPDNADAEYRMLAERCVTNHMPLLVNATAQVLCVDGYRRGAKSATSDKAKESKKSIADQRDLPEWLHWEESRLQSRQDAVHRAALAYGHSFTVTEKDDEGKIHTRGLSPLRTAALYEDAANDDNPVATLYIDRWPTGSNKDKVPGKAFLWDRTYRYEYRFWDDSRWRLVEYKAHGLKDKNPVTRFAASVDLDGRTLGIIEPYFAIQDRLNQTVFDLLIAQTGASFNTRWASGMAPPVQMQYQQDENGNPLLDQPLIPVLDENNQPIPIPLNIHAKKFLYAEDPEAKFGSLPATPLAPYLEAIQQAIKDLSSVTQTPPHYMLGQIANLSADAMRAAEQTLIRKANNFKLVFGECWERVFRLALELAGDSKHEDMTGSVVWRDLEAQSLAQAADAYGKMAESLAIPKRGLWPLLPGITQGTISEWETLYEEEEDMMAAANVQGAFDKNANAPTNEEGQPDAPKPTQTAGGPARP